MLEHHSFCGTRPTMATDIRSIGREKEFSRWYCGFRNMEELNWWFRGYKTWLKSIGFVIRVYKADKIRRGRSKRQIAFLRSNSDLLCKLAGL